MYMYVLKNVIGSSVYKVVQGAGGGGSFVVPLLRYVFFRTQYYHLYANVHSNVISFDVSHFEGFATRVAVLLDDGSVRIMSPPTGNTLAIIYPLPLMQVRYATVRVYR